MHKFGGLVLIAALALTGCATTPQPGAPVEEKRSEASAKAEPAPTLDAAPVETTETEDLYYGAVLRIEGLEETPEEDALKVGKYICDQLDAGAPALDIDTIPSADEYANDQIVLIAALTLCEDHGEAVQQMIFDKRDDF